MKATINLGLLGAMLIDFNARQEKVKCTMEMEYNEKDYRLYFNVNGQHGVRDTRGRAIKNDMITEVLNASPDVQLNYDGRFITVQCEGYHKVTVDTLSTMPVYDAVPYKPITRKVIAVVTVVATGLASLVVLVDSVSNSLSGIFS